MSSPRSDSGSLSESAEEHFSYPSSSDNEEVWETRAQLTFVHYAVMSYAADTLKVLLEKGANPNGLPGSMLPPIYLAIINYRNSEDQGHIEISEKIIDLLVDHGAEIDIQICNNRRAAESFPECVGLTPLMMAAEIGFTHAVKRLTTQVNVNARVQETGYTALFAAAQSGHADIVKFLLANNADAELSLKRTAHEFREFANLNLVSTAMNKFLVSQDLTAPYISIKPYDIAVIMGHKEVAALLLQTEKKATNCPSVTEVGLYRSNVETKPSSVNEASSNEISSPTPFHII